VEYPSGTRILQPPGLPKFVARVSREFLTCGELAHGLENQMVGFR